METTNTRPSPRKRKKSHQIQLGVDVPLLLATITLTVFGLIMVFSASWDFSYIIHDSHTFMFGRQAIFALLGIFAGVAAYLLDYHHWRRLAVPLMAVTVISLIAVFVVNEVRYGAARTLNEGSVMPSEAAKLVTIIYLSVWLYSKRNQIQKLGFGLFPLGVILGIMGGLILAQPTYRGDHPGDSWRHSLFPCWWRVETNIYPADGGDFNRLGHCSGSADGQAASF